MKKTIEPTLTVFDVAANLHVKPRTVRDWINAGKIVFIKLPGGDLRIKESHYAEWLEKQTTKRKRK